MARITVEDCLEKIPNRFQLVLAATYRARMLSQGSIDNAVEAMVDRPSWLEYSLAHSYIGRRSPNRFSTTRSIGQMAGGIKISNIFWLVFSRPTTFPATDLIARVNHPKFRTGSGSRSGGAATQCCS